LRHCVGRKLDRFSGSVLAAINDCSREREFQFRHFAAERRSSPKGFSRVKTRRNQAGDRPAAIGYGDFLSLPDLFNRRRKILARFPDACLPHTWIMLHAAPMNHWASAKLVQTYCALGGTAKLITHLFLLFLFGSSALLAAGAPIHFEQNRGQVDERVRYLVRSPHERIFFTNRQVVFRQVESGPVSFELSGSNSGAEWKADEATGEETSYRIGRDPRHWADHVEHYARLRRHNVYPGIDLAWHATARAIEYDFLVAPGADPSRIRFRIQGAGKIQINADGELVASSPGGDIRQHRPSIYQTAADGSRTHVAGGFRIFGRNEAGFYLDHYDVSKPLVIDPVIDFSTYIGGDGEDEVIYSAGTITVGNTTSLDFPGGSPARRNGWKVFYRDGSYTYIFGGSGDDRVTAVLPPDISLSPYPILFGYTTSKDLPASRVSPAFQAEFAGGATDGFIIQFAPQRGFNTPIISYYGTPGDDRITAATKFSGRCAFTGTTTARGFPTGSPLLVDFAQPQFVQDGPGGALDGFVVGCTTSNTSAAGSTLFLNGVRYFGGTGDDRPSSIAINEGYYYIAGETTSPDLPNLSAASTPRAGDSDAFVVRYETLTTSPTTLIFGGSGSDRASGITRVAYGLAVALAGTTTSRDLPVVQPSQPAFGGGVSDAFVVALGPDLSQIFYSTYWGGSADEVVTAVSSDDANGSFIAGWTSSPDFPVINAVQPKYGGGPDDGFLLHYDATGAIHQSTFFGGSGSDRILTVSGARFLASIGGQTTSKDLPLQNAQQTTFRGPSDGFSARISTNLIGTFHVNGSKGLRAYGYLILPSESTTTYTLTTSDPAAVLLSGTRNGPGEASIAITASYGAIYYVACQADGAAADITITAPGFPSATAHVDCVPPSVSAAAPFATTGGTYSMSIWSPPTVVFVSLYAQNPNYPYDRTALVTQSQADAIPVQIQITDPAVLKTPVTSLLVEGLGEDHLEVTPVGLGTADVVLLLPYPQSQPGAFHVTVTPPFNTGAPEPIPGGFQRLYLLRFSGRLPPDVTFTSEDSNSLLVSTNAAENGSASATVAVSANSARVYLQALASSGEAPLIISVPGLESVTVPVRFKEPALSITGSPSLSLSLSLWTLLQGDSISLGGSFEYYIPNPQSPATRLSLEASDPAVLKVTPEFIDIDTKRPVANFQVQGMAPGAASLTLHTSNSAAPPASTQRLAVIARSPISPRSLQLSDVEVGKNLAALMVLTLPSGLLTSTTIAISTSDPGKALVAATSDGGAQTQISVNATGQRISFYVIGLASTGEARITAAVPGVGSATAKVTLVPSGIGWNTDFVNSDLYNTSGVGGVPLGAYALDPATMLPIAYQTLRQTATVQIQSDRPEVAVPVNNSFVVPSFLPVNIRSLTSGDATLILTQPPGFSTPATRQRLTWRVTKKPLRLSYSINSYQPLGISTQAPVGYYDLPVVARSKNVTISSSDAGKLVLSADPKTLGSGTLTIPAGSTFYLQALDNHGIAYVTASLDGFTDTTFPVQLGGTGILLTAETNGTSSLLKDDGVYTTLESGTTRILLNLASVDPESGSNPTLSQVSLLPGIDPLIFVQSTNPAVGIIQRSPASLDDPRSLVTVDFQPVGLGVTEVSAIQPPGFTMPAGRNGAQNGRILFHVTLPPLQ
jgi:hypothetical protein